MKTANLVYSGVALALLSSCASGSDAPVGLTPQFVDSYVELARERFQKIVDEKPVDLYTLTGSQGMFVKITNYGAKIQQIVVPDKSGKFGDVVLGYDNIDSVIGGQASLGAFMGRYANRIAGGKFTLDGVPYQLALNDGTRPNSLHGGAKGHAFASSMPRSWSSSHVQMNYVFAEGEEGFPGTLELQVDYFIADGSALHIACTATARDKKTVFNFTSHPFFNLSSDPQSLAIDHQLTVNADRVLEINANLIPTGVLRAVAATPMDFRTSKTLGQDLTQSYDLLMLAGGYDHTYVLNKTAEGRLGLAARVTHPASGRTMEVWSTEPAMQLYSGNGFAAQAPRDVGKGGALYALHAGLALEPMHYPDSPNQPSFPSTVLAAGETYKSEIVFKFNVQK